MKKFGMLLLVSVLSGCAASDDMTATASNIGVSIFQTAVKQKCQNEITGHQYYQMASILMTEEQKLGITNKVCGCVSEKAPQSVTMTEIATAAVDSSQRPTIVGKAVKNTLQACVAEWIQQ